MGTKVKRFQIADNAVDSAKVADGSITDADISSTAAIHETKIANLTQDLNQKVSLSGDTLSGVLTLNADPVLPLGAATKEYVEDLLLGAVTTESEFISFIDSTATVVTFGPYAIAIGSQAQINNTGTTIDLTNTSNFESGNTTVGVYYIYATGTGFKISLSIPTFNSVWSHPTQPWRPVASVVRTSSGFIPFLKYNQTVLFKNFQLLLNKPRGSSISPDPHPTATLSPVSATFALVSVYSASSGTHQNAGDEQRSAFIDPTLLTIMDSIYTIGFVANNAYRAFATEDRQNMIVPLTFQGTTGTVLIDLTVGGGQSTTYQNGYIENF